MSLSSSRAIDAPVQGDVQGLPVEIVDHVEVAQFGAVGQGIMHKVHAPGQVREQGL